MSSSSSPSSSRAHPKAVEAARPPSRSEDDAPPEYTVAPVDDITINPEDAEIVQDVSSIQQQQHEDPGDAPPPAYADVYGMLGFNQDGMNTTAQIQDDGRININIEKGAKLTQLLAPTLRRAQSQASQRPKTSVDVPEFAVDVPPLNIVIQIIGSRGDVQPFIALGKVLKTRYRHRVRVATHPTFQGFVEENGLEFFSLGGDPSELMAFMVKNPGLMPGFDSLKAGDVGKRRKAMWEMLVGGWRACIEPGNGTSYRPSTAMDSVFSDKPFVADAIIANPPSFGHIHCAEKLGVPLHLSFTMPWSPTTAFPHPLANIQSTNADNSLTNFLSYAMVDMMTWQGLGDLVNRFRENTLGLDPISVMWSAGLINRLKVPHTYCWSPALIPKPADYGPEITVSGFYFLSLASSYTPPPDLAAFLDAGPPPVYIGFGSIVVDDPDKLTNMILEAVRLTGVRALVSKGWGGIGGDDLEVPDGVFFLGNCPHDWLFPKCSAVVHHGGAGTTSAGIRCGRPTVVVPFFGDQPFWGAMIARSGAGPQPTPFSRLTSEILADNIRTALLPATLARAAELGAKIRDENGTENGARNFNASVVESGLGTCDILKDRVAVWKVRGTKVRLSALAASILVGEGRIENGYGGLKLYRHREWEVNTGPPEPFIGSAGALMGTLSSMMMGVSDIPMGAFKGISKNRKGKGKGKEGGITPPADESGSVKSNETGSSELTETSSMHSLQTTSSRSTSTVDSKQRTRSSSTLGGGGSQMTLDAALGAGRGVGNIVKAGLKSPMDFTLGVAQGFRNAPRLYGDTTIRPQERITGINSGLRAASKEFGLGLYDGITGLVTQPIKGAKEGGGVGLVKGFGKGLGGLVCKPGAGMWGIPGYMMKGLHQEIMNLTKGNNILTYIITARAAQGTQELSQCTAETREYVLGHYSTVLKGKEKQQLRIFPGRKGKSREKLPTSSSTTSLSTPPADLGIPEMEGSLASRPPPSYDIGRSSPPGIAPGSSQYDIGPTPPDPARYYGDEKRKQPEDEVIGFDSDEMEKAIRESVAMTSRGNQEEDEVVERAIRASVTELQKSMEDGDEEDEAVRRAIRASIAERHGVNADDDSEYEEALRNSLETPTSSTDGTLADEAEQIRRAIEESQQPDQQVDEDELLRQAIEESERQGTSASTEEEALKKAMEESVAQQEAEDRKRQMEDEILMRHVYEQSLREEEQRKKTQAERMAGVERAMKELLGNGEGSSRNGAVYSELEG